MAEHIIKMTFTIEAQYTGLVASFYDDPEDRLDLADSAATAFKDDPENAEIFLHVKAGKWRSAAWLLNWFFNKQGKKAEDYLPAEAIEKAFKLGEHTSPQKFRLEFDKGDFKIETTDGPTDLRAVDLLVTFRVRPRAQ